MSTIEEYLNIVKEATEAQFGSEHRKELMSEALRLYRLIEKDNNK